MHNGERKPALFAFSGPKSGIDTSVAMTYLRHQYITILTANVSLNLNHDYLFLYRENRFCFLPQFSMLGESYAILFLEDSRLDLTQDSRPPYIFKMPCYPQKSVLVKITVTATEEN